MLSIALCAPSRCADALRRLAAAIPNRVEIHAIVSANSIQNEKERGLHRALSAFLDIGA
jgi:hypothetical protein